MIDKNKNEKVVKEITIKANCENCRHSSWVSTFGWGFRMVCPHRTITESENGFGLCEKWLPIRKSIANKIFKANIKGVTR